MVPLRLFPSRRHISRYLSGEITGAVTESLLFGLERVGFRKESANSSIVRTCFCQDVSSMLLGALDLEELNVARNLS